MRKIKTGTVASVVVTGMAVFDFLPRSAMSQGLSNLYTINALSSTYTNPDGANPHAGLI